MKQPISKIIGRVPVWVVPAALILFLLVPAAEEIISGWLSPWYELPTPPGTPVKLLGTGKGVGAGLWTNPDQTDPGYAIGDVFILAVDDQLFGFELYDQGWRVSQAEQVISRQSCDRFGPWFGRKQGECVQAPDYESPGVMHRFLLDQQGVLWHWVDSAPIFPSFLFCGLSGLVCGVGLLVALLIYQRKESVQ